MVWKPAVSVAIGVLVVSLGAEPNAKRLTVDSHLHVTLKRGAKPFFTGEPGTGVLTWSTTRKTKNQIEAAHLLQAGGQLALATLWPPVRLRPGRSSLDETLRQVAQLREFCREHPDFALVTTPAEARRQISLGRIALVPAVEGGEGIESVDDVDRLYAAGVRSVTLLHFIDSQLGGAANGQFLYNNFNVVTTGLNPVGLSELGAQVVGRMLQLGIMVDLAHASDETSRAVLALAEAHGAPVLNSHGGSRALLPLERNIPDELAARIAKGGGVVGMTASDHQVARVPASEQWEGYVPGTCDDTIAHWKHLTTVMPAAQVVLGSDFNGMIARPRAGGSCEHGLRNTSDLGALYQGLIAHGVPAEAIDGMGHRFLEMWEKVEAKAEPTRVETARSASPDPHPTFDVAL